jgi:hypothetical protein
MKLENQVVSLELSKRLRELGVKQESLLFYFSRLKFSKKRKESHEWILNIGTEDETRGFATPNNAVLLDKSDDRCISAFTVAELYSLLYSSGICDIQITVKPEELADYLAEMLCKKLSK